MIAWYSRDKSSLRASIRVSRVTAVFFLATIVSFSPSQDSIEVQLVVKNLINPKLEFAFSRMRLGFRLSALKYAPRHAWWERVWRGSLSPESWLGQRRGQGSGCLHL